MASQHTGGWAAAEHAGTRHREGVRLPGEWTGGISRGGKTGVETGDGRLETGSSYILEPVVRDWKRIKRQFPEVDFPKIQMFSRNGDYVPAPSHRS